MHDVFGNVIAELNAAGATVREYIWLPEAEISPTMGSRTVVDRPMAVVSGVNVSPTLLMVHVDHLHRPVKMTNAAGASVWSAVWLPWGGAHTITGAETLDARFPGQWFQLEAGLHYNWHRAYDPTLGRYTQPDPLGFVDGPGVYGYVANDPLADNDFEGLQQTRRPSRTPQSRPPSFLRDPCPGCLIYPPPRPPRRQDYQCHLADGKIHGPISRSDPPTFKRADLERIRDNLQRSITNRERELRERGEEREHRRRVEEERDVLRTVEKLLGN